MISDIVSLGEGEEILVTVRRHWFSLAVEGFFNVVVFSFAIGFVSMVDVLLAYTQTQVHVETVLPLGFFFVSLVGLVLWMRFFASWSDHWLDVWFITNKRIIDIEQKGFFTREVSSFPLEKIQDVTYTTAGIIATWLHFGDVRIQTASISEDFVMRQVPFPDIVKERLVSVMDKEKDEK